MQGENSTAASRMPLCSDRVEGEAEKGQCDQIWRNFATLAKLFKSSSSGQGII